MAAVRLRRARLIVAGVSAMVFVSAWAIGAGSLVYETVVFRGGSVGPSGARAVPIRNGSQVRYVTEGQARRRSVLAWLRETMTPFGLLSGAIIFLVTPRTSPVSADGKLDVADDD